MEDSVYTILCYYATFSFDPYLFMLTFIASTPQLFGISFFLECDRRPAGAILVSCHVAVHWITTAASVGVCWLVLLKPRRSLVLPCNYEYPTLSCPIGKRTRMKLIWRARIDSTKFFSLFSCTFFYIYIERSGWKEYYLVVYISNLVKFRSIDNYYSNETLPFQKRCLSRDDIYSWYKSWSLRHIFLFFDIKLHHHEALFAFYESPSGIFLFRQKTPSWLRCSLANHSKISCYPPFATKCRYVSLIRRICKETFIEKSDD